MTILILVVTGNRSIHLRNGLKSTARAFGQEDDITVLTLTPEPAGVLT
jgi:hypothetical protein